jgi:hypothetical protein
MNSSPVPHGSEAEPESLVSQARRRAIGLLRANTVAAGPLAASPSPRAASRHYDTIFGRDAAICALAAALVDDAVLLRGAVCGLDTLAAGQAANGQIPKFVVPGTGEADFWYLGCTDATLWWLIAADGVGRRVPDAGARWRAPAQRALAWCRAQEHQSFGLVQQNEASDWADVMPRSGFVLYSNALWYLVKKLYSLPGIDQTREFFNALFHPFSKPLPEYRRGRILAHYARRHARDRGWYLSFVNLAFCGNEGDTLGNCLAILSGAVDEADGHRTLRALEAARAAEPYPARATCEPIGKGDPLWRHYMSRHLQNLEHQYHNGGIWPMIGGFWVMALAALGRGDAAHAALVRLARSLSLDDWAFREWFHGATLEPLGMAGQSWSAAAFLLAHAALDRPVHPFSPYAPAGAS